MKNGRVFFLGHLSTPEAAAAAYQAAKKSLRDKDI
jgi:hypothetical protein